VNVIFSIHRAEQAINTIFADVVGKGSPLTVSRAIVLQALATAPGVSQTALTAMTGIDRSTMATMVRALDALRFVKRVKTKDDQRAYAVTLTAAGQKTAQTAAQALAETVRRLLIEQPKVRALA
jgi:DNA-binding MarR family transcriptional regulator